MHSAEYEQRHRSTYMYNDCNHCMYCGSELYISPLQLAPTAVAFLPQSFDLRPDVVRLYLDQFLQKKEDFVQVLDSTRLILT